MPPHPDHISASLNFAGFLCGVASYGMLLVLALRSPLRPAGSTVDLLPVATGVLGLTWNLGAILVYGMHDLGLGPAPGLLSALAFTALGCLPAVVVHSVLRAQPRDTLAGPSRGLVAVAYGLSGVAGLIHVGHALSGGAPPAASALQVQTVGFTVLAVPLVLATRRQDGWRRAFWLVALAVFAVSALHLSEHDDFTSPWWVQVLGHHASLPLAVAILSQDYPFAFGDLLLKRMLALGALVGVAVSGLLLLSMSPLVVRYGFDLDEPPVLIGLLLLTVGAALCYPWLRRLADWFVDALILRRVDRDQVVADVGRLAQDTESVDALMEEVCALLTRALSAQAVTWSEVVAGGTPTPQSPAIFHAMAGWEASSRTVLVTTGPEARSATVIVPTSDMPALVMTVGPLSGGRRLLSADTALLERTAIVLARRIDAIRLAQERFERRYRDQEASRLATEAELRALRAQINPHFLFNALTTIGYLIQTAPPRALQTLLRLTELLRRALRSEGEVITFGAELDLVSAYLDIERARFEERLQVVVDVPVSLRDIPVPAFFLQPLVENAVKHGIAPSRAGGTVTIASRLRRAATDHAAASGPSGGSELVVTVTDTGAGAAGLDRKAEGEGVGLSNVERRLALAYGPLASLRFESQDGKGARVEVRVPVPGHVPAGESAAPDVAARTTS